eukprot:3990341-Amphidinium_carterae.5
MYFAGCSGCAGLSLRFRQSINADPEFAARVGLTPEQVQMSRDRGLLDQPRVAETLSAASEVAGASAVSGAARNEQATASGAVGSGVATGPAQDTARSSTVRMAETLADEDQEAHKFIRLDDETVSKLWGSERLSKVAEITGVAVAVPMERNDLDYSHIDLSD